MKWNKEISNGGSRQPGRETSSLFRIQFRKVVAPEVRIPKIITDSSTAQRLGVIRAADKSLGSHNEGELPSSPQRCSKPVERPSEGERKAPSTHERMGISGTTQPPKDLVQFWGNFFTNNLEQLQGFEGNTGNASQLMASFDVGREYILGQFGEVFKEEKDIPSLSITVNVPSEYPPVFHDSESNKTVIRKRFIENASRLDPNEHRALRDRGGAGEIVLVGTVNDLFLLAGIEETHHAVYGHLHPDEDADTGHKRNDLTRAQYNALDPEWQALDFKIKYAREHNMSEETIRFLSEIQNTAKEVRRQQGLPNGDTNNI